MVLPLLVAGGYGAAALASAAGAARLRRQLAKMAAGPAGEALASGVPLRRPAAGERAEKEVARLGRTLATSEGPAIAEEQSLFDFVLVTSERIVLHNAHAEDTDFHEAEAEMSIELAWIADLSVQGGLQSELSAFVFVHGYKVEIVVSKVWGYRKVCRQTFKVLELKEFSLPPLEFDSRGTFRPASETFVASRRRRGRELSLAQVGRRPVFRN